MGYTKLFSEIIHSTIWTEPSHVKIVWVTMLAMADDRSEVRSSIPGLARASGVTIKECEDALKCFLSPDPYSRSQEYEGRRIIEVDGGWKLLNGDKYRSLRSAEERREYQRRWKAEKRAKEKKKTIKKSVKPTLEEVTQYFLDNGFSKELAKKAFNYYEAGNWKDSKGNQVKAWKQKMQGVWFKEENKTEENHDPAKGAK